MVVRKVGQRIAVIEKDPTGISDRFEGEIR